ncbi:MAG: electron transfer flavoprotein subunit alpha/FixB family protein [Desulfobacterales bacterium]|nr:electron transfer flavoprotein subunit alpha/FixB family protein [Desulfobacterales bacterium]
MAGEVWVFAEHHDGTIRKTSLELLGKGRELAGHLGVDLAALLLGSGVDGLAKGLAAYADKVYQWDDPLVKQYNSDVYLQVIANQAEKERPQLILAGATSLARDLFPRVAGRLKTGIAVDCISLELGEEGLLVARRPLFGGKALVDVVSCQGRPQIALTRPNTFPLPDAKGPRKGRIVPLEVAIDPAKVKLEVLEVVRVARERLDLTEAQIIVTGGSGMKAAGNFSLLDDLADVLGATVGATRGVVDSGWRPHDDQVGKSGKTVSPKLYSAVGLSGAIHHVMGMETSQVVVAINKDPRAPIFHYADYGIQGDLFEVVPLLIEELKKELGKG